MKYGILSQHNPAYRAREWRELSDLYRGGYDILSNARNYLPQMIGESDARYCERLKVAAYLCYLGQIVDFFVANLFCNDIKIGPAPDADNPGTLGGQPSDPNFYTALASNIDRRGTTLAMLLRQILTTALIKGRALVGVDFPRPGEVLPLNRAQEEESGLSRAYAFEVPVEELIDWERDEESGTFEFAILHRTISRRQSPAQRRGSVYEEFKIWTASPTGAAWELYRTQPYEEEHCPRADDDVPMVDSGNTSFRRIPLVELALPAGLWVGNKVGPVAKEHFQRRNILTAAENKSLFAIPYVALGSEVGAPGMALPSEVQQDPNRGRDPRIELANKGYLVIGSGDSVGFAEPSGSCYAVVESQLRDLKDEMFRVVHQMAASVSNIGASLGRSGDSKQEDRKATAIVLGALGALVRDLAKRVYTVISEARGESVVWMPHGLDQYDGEARDLILAEAIQLNSVPIPSPTFLKTWKTRTALHLLPNIEPETAEAIKREIEAGVEKEYAQPTSTPPAVQGDGQQQTPLDDLARR